MAESPNNYESIVSTPNLLFGNDVYFPPPPSLQRDAERYYLDRQRLLAYHNVIVSEEELRHGAEMEARHAFFERRFRSRELPEAVNESLWQWFRNMNVEGYEFDPADTSEITTLLDQLLMHQCWSAAFYLSRHWHELLPEDFEEREIAHRYAAFSGGIAAYEFCKIALNYTNPAFAEEYKPRIKHVITVCWPIIEDLARFAPEEAAEKMQLLREIMLEYVSQPGNGFSEMYMIDSFIAMIGSDTRLSEAESVRKFFVMDSDDETKAMVRRQTDLRVEELTRQHRYDLAIRFLGRSGLALSIHPLETQQRIDRIAEIGAPQLRRLFPDVDPYDIDMGAFSIDQLLANNLISKEVRERLKDPCEEPESTIDPNQQTLF